MQAIRADQLTINTELWRRGELVATYANRTLLPVEALILARYREALSGRVLELGCGAGRILGYLVALGGEVHGIDISAAMVEHCRAAYPQAHVRLGDITAIQACAAGQFSAVLGPDNVLDVLDDANRRRVLRDLRALLDAEGLLIFSGHNLDYATGPRAGDPRGRPGARRLERARDLLRSRSMAEAAGYVPRIPRRMLNRRRLAPLQQRAADHAIINDQAHDYGLLHYYIDRRNQARQLAECGYDLLECLDVHGDHVADGVRSPSPWLHYIARPVR